MRRKRTQAELEQLKRKYGIGNNSADVHRLPSAQDLGQLVQTSVEGVGAKKYLDGNLHIALYQSYISGDYGRVLRINDDLQLGKTAHASTAGKIIPPEVEFLEEVVVALTYLKMEGSDREEAFGQLERAANLELRPSVIQESKSRRSIYAKLILDASAECRKNGRAELGERYIALYSKLLMDPVETTNGIFSSAGKLSTSRQQLHGIMVESYFGGNYEAAEEAIADLKIERFPNDCAGLKSIPPDIQFVESTIEALCLMRRSETDDASAMNILRAAARISANNPPSNDGMHHLYGALIYDAIEAAGKRNQNKLAEQFRAQLDKLYPGGYTRPKAHES